MTYRVAAVAFALFVCLPSAQAFSAQQSQASPDKPTFVVKIPSFSDDDVAGLVVDLDARLSKHSGLSNDGNTQKILVEFAHRLQQGVLTSTQETRVLNHLSEIQRALPDAAGVAVEPSRIISQLTIGKTAPDITGADLDGIPMRLGDYRGRVVLLTFSGDWCGICRTQYPYERLLQELYRNWPFAIVSVDSDADRASAKRAQTADGLAFRSWWDGNPVNGPGPIARAWSVDGWPTSYLIDANGVIRFVDLRSEDLLKGVKQLLAEMPATGGRPGGY